MHGWREQKTKEPKDLEYINVYISVASMNMNIDIPYTSTVSGTSGVKWSSDMTEGWVALIKSTL